MTKHLRLGSGYVPSCLGTIGQIWRVIAGGEQTSECHGQKKGIRSVVFHMFHVNECNKSTFIVPSVKLTWPLKVDGRKMWSAYFQGRTVGCREGKPTSLLRMVCKFEEAFCSMMGFNIPKSPFPPSPRE